ncbi:hypothetical protein ABS768_04635 [Flavobacterium sp. ST-75]|uniref:Lipoprotein n=1 Tax=Flavobacterium rhizophilum TaxID=3163296 RepID=A0ABW8Y987_9FLAO
MIKKALFGIIMATFFSCQNKEKVINKDKIDENVANIQNNHTNDLRFDDFKNTKWIVGEEGLNGELPDTIIFVSSGRLDYISTDTGKESCIYRFVKDSLVYISHVSEFNTESDSDMECEIRCCLLFDGNQFKYIYEDKKCPVDSIYNRTVLEEYNIAFRKVQ